MELFVHTCHVWYSDLVNLMYIPRYPHWMRNAWNWKILPVNTFLNVSYFCIVSFLLLGFQLKE